MANRRKESSKSDCVRGIKTYRPPTARCTVCIKRENRRKKRVPNNQVRCFRTFLFRRKSSEKYSFAGEALLDSKGEREKEKKRIYIEGFASYYVKYQFTSTQPTKYFHFSFRPASRSKANWILGMGNRKTLRRYMYIRTNVRYHLEWIALTASTKKKGCRGKMCSWNGAAFFLGHSAAFMQTFERSVPSLRQLDNVF